MNEGDVEPVRASPDLPTVGKTEENFAAFLGALLEDMGTEKVTTRDHDLLLNSLKKRVRELERHRRRGLSHEWVTLDKRCRLTLKKELRAPLGWGPGDTLDCHLYPDHRNPRGLLVMREKR